MTPPPLVQAVHLTKSFCVKRRVLQAVNQLSFSIGEGEILGLAGESGCGKSTVGKLLLRLLEPSRGSVLFQGQDIHDLSKKKLTQLCRRMQIIFQNPSTSLNPRMTIGEIISEPLDIHHVARGSERRGYLEELISLVGLHPTYLGRLPHEMSGGQKQRVSIARALAIKPQFLVCDEPLSALDVSVQAQIINLLKKLHRDLGLSYLFISHDLSVMRDFVNRIAIMYLGEIVEMAPVASLYQTPLHPYTQALLSAIPIPDPQVERKRSRIVLKGDIPSPFHPPMGCRFHPRCPFAQPICMQQAPQQKEVKPGHFVACHLGTHPSWSHHFQRRGCEKILNSKSPSLSRF